MYILIFEDGTIAKTESLCEDLLSNAADGYLDVIDASNLTIYTPINPSRRPKMTSPLGGINRLRDAWSEIKDDEVYKN